MEEILASINRMIADEKKPEAIARPAADPKDDVLELTEAMGEDGTVRRITPKGADRIEPEPPRVTAGDGPPAAEPKLDPAIGDHVRSAAAAGAAAAAFGRLATAPRADRKPEDRGRVDSAHTLEDIVREALQPLLQAWLAEHLPGLAEKLAREEVARVLQEAGLR